MCEYSRSRSFHDDLILQDQASGECSQDQWSSGIENFKTVAFFCLYSSVCVGPVQKPQSDIAGFLMTRLKSLFLVSCVTNGRAKPQKPRRWKSMLIYQGWFPALYTQHLLDSQSFEFEICIFAREAIPSHYFPLPRRLVPSLSLGTTWVRQLRSGSCHYPTAATKCNERPSQTTETPSVEKHAHPPRVVYCAIYSTLTRFTKFRV